MMRTFLAVKVSPTRNLAHDINRAAEHHAALLNFRAHRRSGAKRLEGRPRTMHERGKLSGSSENAASGPRRRAAA